MLKIYIITLFTAIYTSVVYKLHYFTTKSYHMDLYKGVYITAYVYMV